MTRGHSFDDALYGLVIKELEGRPDSTTVGEVLAEWEATGVLKDKLAEARNKAGLSIVREGTS